MSFAQSLARHPKIPATRGQLPRPARDRLAPIQLTGIPGGSVAEAAIRRYFRRRAAQARDILFEELRHANISEAQAASENDAIAVIVRYLRAAREGTARLNLRLLAKAIAGKLKSGRLVADEFLQYAEAVGSLSRDEIIVIGAVYKVAEHQDLAATNPTEAVKYTDPWVLATQELASKGMTEELVAAIAARAHRSGLIYGMAAPLPKTAGGTFGGTTQIQPGTDFPSAFYYRITPMLIELGKTVDFPGCPISRNVAARLSSATRCLGPIPTAPSATPPARPPARGEFGDDLRSRIARALLQLAVSLLICRRR